ncbi:6-phosphogluconate dehydrogenase C-terminal domain-like protein [Clavulina sp. PMI_390]|nr:6-phosphogluconate dehydrogenase C-terminal domain-like protein [Clavulina sp. PMI_390]
MENTLIFGLGGIGAVFGLLLQRSKRTTLSTVARSNFGVVQKDGIKVQSTQIDGGGTVTFDRVYPANAHQQARNARASGSSAIPFSYVVVATKLVADTKPSLVESLEPFIAPGKSTIVLIQNGVGIEDEIQARWPGNLVLTSIAFFPATQTEPGLVVHPGGLFFRCGPFHSNGSPECSPREKERIDTFMEMCRIGGCETETEYNHVYMQAQRWTKIAWNASWNSVTTLADLDSAAYLAASSSSEALARRIMREVVLVARGLGVEIDPLEPGVLNPEEAKRVAKALGCTERLDDMLVNRLKNFQNINTSTRTDVLEGRALEYEVIWGNPLKHAKRLGIEVPVFETVAILLEAIDARNRGKVKVMIRAKI